VKKIKDREKAIFHASFNYCVVGAANLKSRRKEIKMKIKKIKTKDRSDK